MGAQPVPGAGYGYCGYDRQVRFFVLYFILFTHLIQLCCSKIIEYFRLGGLTLSQRKASAVVFVHHMVEKTELHFFCIVQIR